MTRGAFVWPLVCLVSGVGLAGCGPEGGAKAPAHAVGAPSGSALGSTPAPASSNRTPSVGTAAPMGTGTTPAPQTYATPPLGPTTMETQLREIGVDPAALPPLNKLDPKTLRDVMNTFTKALGVKCNHCHEKDFKAPTPNKKITTHMWNDFTRALALEGGGALYCDSCHGGHPRFLDRHDPSALGLWMQENYVDKMRRAGEHDTQGPQVKKDHTCGTCHGEPFEGHIFTKRWK